MSEVVVWPDAGAPPAKAQRLHWSDTSPPNVRWSRPPPPLPMKTEATPERLLLSAMVASLRPTHWLAVIERVRALPTDTPSNAAQRRVAMEIALGDFASEPSDRTRQ